MSWMNVETLLKVIILNDFTRPVDFLMRSLKVSLTKSMMSFDGKDEQTKEKMGCAKHERTLK